MKGAILIFSCEKHRNTRLPKYHLPESEYEGWMVFYVFANRFQEKDFVFDNDVITVKTEDSYLHLTKKVAMCFHAILSTFDIEEGILRCGDDLVFNIEALKAFLRSKTKTDYMGFCWNVNSSLPMSGKYINTFMPEYYSKNQRDFDDPLHGLPPYETVMNMNEIPRIQGASGVIVYFSKRSCEYIVQELDSIKWDITVYDPYYGYVYIIEDIANACILGKHNIFATESPFWTDNQKHFDSNNYIAFHTNDAK